MDFDVQRCTRHCAKTEQELQPDEMFYSVLIVEGADVMRYDYSAEVWEGPPEAALGWWKSKMPGRNAKKIHWAPNDVLLEYFEQLEDQTLQRDTRYILALLLIRRRVVRLEETEQDDQNTETMILYCPRRESTYKVLCAMPTEPRIEEIQEELAKLLFADAE